MTDSRPFFERRSMLRAGGLLSVLAGARVSWAQGSTRATVVVAGPDGGSLDRWYRVVQPALAHGLRSDTVVRRSSVGGPDGVTGANRFIARGEPDGLTLLLAPGDAALAWMVGDSRAKYDVNAWMPVMAGLTSGVVVARPGAIAPNQRVRLSSPGAASADLPAILGIELLGARTELVPALPRTALMAAFARGDVDAVFLRGHKVPSHLVTLTEAGGVPAFCLGMRDDNGKLVRYPGLPDVPTLPQAHAQARGPMPGGPLLDAWCAASVASRLEFTLVLPMLTPASSVALWRQAALVAAASPDVQSLAQALGVRPIAGVEASTIAAVSADEVALTELRRWLSARFNWRPA